MNNYFFNTLLIIFLILYLYINRHNTVLRSIIDNIIINIKESINKFHSNKLLDTKEQCRKPTADNPYMNQNAFTTNKACEYEKNKNMAKFYYQKELFTDTNELWGKYIWDRQFYTMPYTGYVNNQNEFANWCYDMKNSGKCKILGIDCVNSRDLRYI